MDERPEDAAADDNHRARQAAREAIESYLVSRAAHWKNVAEENADSPDAKEWQKTRQDAEGRLLLWQEKEEAEDDTVAAAVEAVWDEAKHLRSALLNSSWVTGEDEAKKEYAKRWHDADLIEKGALLLGFDIEVDRTLPPDDDPDANA